MTNTTDNPWLMFVQMQRDAFRRYQLIPLSIIMVVGILANTIVICAGVKKSIRKKYSTNSFILNLAVADLGVLLYFIPLHIIEYTIGLDVSNWTCKYVIPLRETFLIVSIFLVADLGIVRFLQIHSSYVFSKRVTYLIITATWLLAYFAVSMPLSFVIRHTDAMTCDHIWDNVHDQRIHMGMLNTIQFIPLLITTVCYLSIIRKVRNLNSEYHSGRDELSRSSSNELRILMIMLIVTAWWSLAPFLIYSLIITVKTTIKFPLKAWSAIAVFSTSSSAINPVLILFMNRDYRNKIRGIFYKTELTASAMATQTSGISGQTGFNLHTLQDGNILDKEKCSA